MDNFTPKWKDFEDIFDETRQTIEKRGVSLGLSIEEAAKIQLDKGFELKPSYYEYINSDKSDYITINIENPSIEGGVYTVKYHKSQVNAISRAMDLVHRASVAHKAKVEAEAKEYESEKYKDKLIADLSSLVYKKFHRLHIMQEEYFGYDLIDEIDDEDVVDRIHNAHSKLRKATNGFMDDLESYLADNIK